MVLHTVLETFRDGSKSGIRVPEEQQSARGWVSSMWVVEGEAGPAATDCQSLSCLHAAQGHFFHTQLFHHELVRPCNSRASDLKK